VGVATNAPLELSGHSLHLWSQDGGALAWLGSVPSLSDVASVTVPGGTPLISRSGLQILVSAEPGTGADPLARSSGWLLASGQLDETLRSSLESVLGEHGFLARLAAEANVAKQHAHFAKDATSVAG